MRGGAAKKKTEEISEKKLNFIYLRKNKPLKELNRLIEMKKRSSSYDF